MALTSYTSALDADQIMPLKALLTRENFEFVEKPYTHYAAKKGKLNVSVYEKGPKVLVQGKETEHFVQFYLEPEILGEAKLGYEEVHNPEMFEPHFGIDESGKGDYFGPLVIAGVYTDADITRHLDRVRDPRQQKKSALTIESAPLPRSSERHPGSYSKP